METYDAIVVGLGATGSSTLYHLARRGLRVLGIDKFVPPHAHGSSHGHNRIIRLAYHEHPSYVPLLKRAYALWRELETKSGEPLLHITGSIDAGPEDDIVFSGAKLACEMFDLPHTILSHTQLADRYPAYHLPHGTWALLQPQGGFLDVERCINAHLTLAQAHGATIITQCALEHWEANAQGVRVFTATSEYTASKMVLCTGAWMPDHLPAFRPHLQPERLVVAWFQAADPSLVMPKNFPVFNMTMPEGRFYGLPSFGIEGLKIGRWHHLHESIHPETVDRTVSEVDLAVLTDCIKKYFPRANGTVLQSSVCLVTNMRDENFVMDLHPEHPHVVIMSACSGHGFKFASVLGEIAADLSEFGKTEHGIAMHRWPRGSSTL